MLSTSNKHSALRFSEIAQNVTERVNPAEATTEVYVGLEHLNPDSIHLQKWGHPSDVIGDKFAFKKGDVIFGRRRAYQRKLAIAEINGICSAHAMVLRANPKVILPEFLPFFLSSDEFMERAIGISVGSLSPTINWSTIKNEKFNLPPLDEQKNLAELLWAIDDVIEQWKNTEDCVRYISEKIINSLIGLDKSANVDQRICISDISSINPKLPRSVNRSGIVSFIAMEDLSEDGHILRQCNKAFSDVSKGYTPFEEGDVLFAKITPCMENGKGTLVQNLDNPLGFGSTEFIVLRPFDERDRLFLFYFTHSISFRKLAESWMQGSAGQRRVAVDLFREEKFLIPPIEERIRIGLYLQKLNDLVMKAQRHILLTHNMLKITINDNLKGASNV